MSGIMLFVPNKNKRTGVYGPAYSDGNKLYFLDNHIEKQEFGFYGNCKVTRDQGNFAFVSGVKIDTEEIKYRDVVKFLDKHGLQTGEGLVGHLTHEGVDYVSLATVNIKKDDNTEKAFVLFKYKGEIISIDYTADLAKKFQTTYTSLDYLINNDKTSEEILAEYYIEEAQPLTRDDIILTVVRNIENYRNIKVINDRYIINGNEITSLIGNTLMTYEYPDFDNKVNTVKTSHITPEFIRDYCSKNLITITDDREHAVIEQSLDINGKMYTVTSFNCHFWWPLENDPNYQDIFLKVRDSYQRLAILKKQLSKEATPESIRLCRELTVSNLLNLQAIR